MRALVAALGSRGDVQPGLALAQRLRKAGHDAVVSAPVDFAGWSQALGLPFVQSDDVSFEKLLKDNVEDVSANPLRIMRMLKPLYESHMPLWYERTLAAAEGCDVIVFAGQYAAVSAAERLGIPCFGVAFSPTLLPSRAYPPFISGWQGLPGWANALGWNLLAFAYDGMRDVVNRQRARMGLAPAASVFRLMYGAPYLVAVDPELAPAPADWSGRSITTTGTWFYDDPAALDEEVERFLAAGDPPVYVGFGSMVSEDIARVTRVTIAGAAARGRRVLMSKGWAGLGEGQLPACVKVVHAPMPHAKLFPRVAAVVHHGGSGTTAQALRAGVPQVIVPHMADQFYYAERLRQLGVAPRGIPVRHLTAVKLSEALDCAFALDPAPRRAIAERLRSSDGIARAIAILEERVGKPRAAADFRYGGNR